MLRNLKQLNSILKSCGIANYNFLLFLILTNSLFELVSLGALIPLIASLVDSSLIDKIYNFFSSIGFLGINKFVEINKKIPCKFYLAGGKNDHELFAKFLNSSIASNCISFKDLTIQETLPIIQNCNIYIGNDTGWLHISSALNKKCLALFMDSPVQAYGKYSKNISIIVPEGETEETTTHNTLGEKKISFEKVLNKSLELLN